MNYLALLSSSVWALLRNKMRSLLTVLGITIGIAAVICVVAIGRAGQARVEQQLNNLGDNFVWIEAGGRAPNGVRTGSHGTTRLTVGDAEASKLVLLEAGDFLRCEPRTVGEVGNQRDLHDILSQRGPRRGIEFPRVRAQILAFAPHPQSGQWFDRAGTWSGVCRRAIPPSS